MRLQPAAQVRVFGFSSPDGTRSGGESQPPRRWLNAQRCRTRTWAMSEAMPYADNSRTGISIGQCELETQGFESLRNRVNRLKTISNFRKISINAISAQVCSSSVIVKGNRNNKTFLQRLRCILCVITLHPIISYYKMRFYTRKTELEASTCKFPRNLRS